MQRRGLLQAQTLLLPGAVWAKNAENWTAIMAPATTPDAIVARLGAEAVAIMNLPDVAERARSLGFRVDARVPAEFAPFLQAETERWAVD